MMKQYISPKIKSLHLLFLKNICNISRKIKSPDFFFKKNIPILYEISCVRCVLLSILIVRLFVNKFFSVGNK